MRMLSNNECEMISGGLDRETDLAEEFKEKETGVPHDCKRVKHPGGDYISCKPRRPSANVFLG